jgi:hypothetical protein
MEYVAFEVDRANLGRRRGPDAVDQERRVAALAVQWNRALVARAVPLRVCPAYRHTGNYWLASESALPVAEVGRVLLDVVGRGFAVFTVEEYLTWLTSMKHSIRQPPGVRESRRPTPGAVMNLDPAGVAPPPAPSDERIAFDEFAVPRVRAVWKCDVLTERGTLDNRPEHREGGWGSVARLMRTRHGGRWTARAMSTLEGVADIVRPG